MNNLFIHRSLTESKNTFLNGVLTSDIIYGDSGSFNFRTDIWTYPLETVFPMLYGEGYTIHDHLAPFELVYLKELTGYFAEGPDIRTSGIYNNLSIDDDLGNVNSSIETGCNTHRQTDWVKDKPGQEAYFDKNVTSKDDPDLKGRIYVGKTFRELRENNFLYYGDEKGDLHQRPLPIFGLKEDTREASGQGGRFPLDERVNSYLKYPGRFGDSRDGGSRKHGGADLYAPVGTNVYAVKGGTVIQNPYKFFQGSYAIQVNHGSFIARYSEINIASGLHAGSFITQGQLIGTVADLSLNKSMLHFEMFSGSATGPLTNRANLPYMRRSDLIDPTHFLNFGY